MSIALRNRLPPWVRRAARIALNSTLWFLAFAGAWGMGFACGAATTMATLNAYGSEISTYLAEYAVRVKGFDPDPTVVQIHLTAEDMTAVNWDDLNRKELHGKK